MHRIARWTAALTMALAMLPMSACIYMNVKQPLDTDLHDTQLGTKVGKSRAQSILGIVAWGDAGTQAAARDGGITTLKHADRETLAILGGLYARFRTIVYGD
jgi:hypothetical protein